MHMSDDDRNVSAREWRAVREGDTHSAPKTSPNNTPESFIVGVGASGALLAGAAIVFVTLVGLVSFNVWPKAQDSSTDGNVELSAATKSAPASNGPSNSTVVPVSAAAGQVASATVGGSGGAAGGGNGSGNGGGKQGANGGDIKGGPVPAPSSPTPAPPSGGSGTTGGGSDGSSGGGDTGSGGPVSAIKDPTHPVHPTHPSHPHQSTPVGDKGKDPGDVSSGDSTGVTGKPPFRRPTDDTNTDTSTQVPTPQGSDQSSGQQTDSSSDDSPASGCRGRGSTRSRH
jgi:hypothetical protein